MSPRKMRLEPLLPWDGEFPYRTLARLGLTPDSPARAVLDASFDLTPEDLADERVSAAWEALRSTRGRLLLDFFCPELPDEAPPCRPPAPRAPLLPWGYLQELAETWPDGLLGPGEGRVPPPDLPPTLGGEYPLWQSGLTTPAEGETP